MRFSTLVRVSVIALLTSLLHVATAAPASATVPNGVVDALSSPEPGKVYLGGWAFDPDEPSRYVTIHVYVGSYGTNIGEAAGYRPDVNAVYGVGAYHGFDAVFDVPVTGDLPYEVYGIDTQGGPPALIRTGRVTVVDPTPTGAIESSSSPAHRSIQLAGWATDPNAPAAPVAIEAYVGGSFSAAGVEYHPLTANLSRSDGKLGFSGQFATAKTGVQDIYVYAKNVPGTPGTARLIGIAKVTVYVDSTPPETTITSAPTVATPQDVIRMSYSASEAGSTFQCRWDSGAWASCPGATTISLPPGQHTFDVRATDAAGNTDPTPASAVVVVSNYVTQPLPGADRAVKVGAVKKKSRLRINIDPDSAADNYRVTIQRKAGKRWRKVQRARTRGDRDVVVVDLRRGKYRVVLPAQDLSPAITSGVVRLKR